MLFLIEFGQRNVIKTKKQQYYTQNRRTHIDSRLNFLHTIDKISPFNNVDILIERFQKSNHKIMFCCIDKVINR